MVRSQEDVAVQAMLKYDAASREVQLTVDRDYKAGTVTMASVTNSLLQQSCQTSLSSQQNNMVLALLQCVHTVTEAPDAFNVLPCCTICSLRACMPVVILAVFSDFLLNFSLFFPDLLPDCLCSSSLLPWSKHSLLQLYCNRLIFASTCAELMWYQLCLARQ